MAGNCEAIGHARDEIPDAVQTGSFAFAPLPPGRQVARICAIAARQVANDALWEYYGTILTPEQIEEVKALFAAQ